MTLDEFCRKHGIDYVELPFFGRSFNIDTISPEGVKELSKKFPDDRVIKTFEQLKDRMSGYTEEDQLRNAREAISLASQVKKNPELLTTIKDEYYEYTRDDEI